MMRAGFPVAPLVRVDYWQGGGGGWGDPFRRPVEWVVSDVRRGLVSVDRAREAYGVAVTCTDEDLAAFEVDEVATKELRATAVRPDGDGSTVRAPNVETETIDSRREP
jgi:N-methylhydantoinase B